MKTRLLLPLLLILAFACGPKWEAHEGDGYLYISQKDGPTLGYTSASTGPVSSVMPAPGATISRGSNQLTTSILSN